MKRCGKALQSVPYTLLSCGSSILLHHTHARAHMQETEEFIYKTVKSFYYLHSTSPLNT